MELPVAVCNSSQGKFSLMYISRALIPLAQESHVLLKLVLSFFLLKGSCLGIRVDLL